MKSESFTAEMNPESPIHEQKPLKAKETTLGCDRLVSLPKPTPVMMIFPTNQVYEVQTFPISWLREQKIPTDRIPYPDRLLNDDWLDKFDHADHFSTGDTEVFVPHSVNWRIHSLMPPEPDTLTPPAKEHETQSGSNDTILPYPGGKGRFASWITNNFPSDHRTYVEPFAGSAAVFLETDPTPDEILNDANTDLYTFLRVSKRNPEKLINFIEQIPYARKAYEQLINDWTAGERPDDDIKRAGVFWTIQQMNMHGKLDQKAGFKTQPKYSCGRTFYNAKQHLAETVDRFASVTIECRDWTKIVEMYDTDETHFYCDPPYENKDNEYSDTIDHDRLFAILNAIDGKFAVSCENIQDRVRETGLHILENNQRRRRGGQQQETVEKLVLNYDPNTGKRLSIDAEYASPKEAIQGTVNTEEQQTLSSLL